MIRFLTAGESHGKSLTAIIEGLPAGLKIDIDFINQELARRQAGYGRGPRMKLEKDTLEITAGVRYGKTLASPIALNIQNKDWSSWEEVMSVVFNPSVAKTRITRPRPGHADFAGAIKYNHDDIRNVIERSSARETAIRVATGAVCKLFLREFDIKIYSHVIEIGGIRASVSEDLLDSYKKALDSPLFCPDKGAEGEMIKRIDEVTQKGDSLGGVFEVFVVGLPIGLGSYVHWDRRLDGQLAQAIMSIPAIKGVEFGLGFTASRKFGSEVHDEISFEGKGGKGVYFHRSNNAGGIEGGMTNGEMIVIRAAMKPIPTLKKPLYSVDMETKEIVPAGYERSDVCAVPAASVISEAMVAIVLSNTIVEKFGGDSMEEIKKSFKAYLEYIKGR